MAKKSLLIPTQCEEPQVSTPQTPNNELCLKKENYLSEFINSTDKQAARTNLGVYSKDEVYTKEFLDEKLESDIQSAISQYLLLTDPHGILPKVKILIKDFVKNNGTTPFISPQEGVTPVEEQHLTTKKYVDDLLAVHISSSDPHNVIPVIRQILTNYALRNEIYAKSQLYTRNQIADLLKEYVKKNGTIAFLAPQQGVDPIEDYHLATKRYIDQQLQAHIMSDDPHHFLNSIKAELAKYILKSEVYTKMEVYNKTELNNIIAKTINTYIKNALQEYKNGVDAQLEAIYLQNYVKADGSIPFTKPQQGVPAVMNNELVTLQQMLSEVLKVYEYIDNKLEGWKWTPSGPVTTTVGHVSNGTRFPFDMSLQEVVDAIFYGQSVNIITAHVVPVNSTTQVKICIRGSLEYLINVVLKQQDKVIKTFTVDEFNVGCVTVESEPILQDTVFSVVANYKKNVKHTAKSTVICALPIFVGLLPKWKFGHTVSMEYLQYLEREHGDEGNKFVYIPELDKVSIDYNFKDIELRHPFIAIPKQDKKLDFVKTSIQKFDKSAFDIITEIPLDIDGITEDVLYEIYIYRQALSSLNQEFIYNFK